MTNQRRKELGERHPSVLRADQELAWKLVHAVNDVLKGAHGLRFVPVEQAVRDWFRAHEGESE